MIDTTTNFEKCNTRIISENNNLGYEQMSDPDFLRATKLRKIAKNLGVVSARLGRTRSETRKQSNLSKIQTVMRSRYRQRLLKRVSLAKTESQNLSQVFGEQKDYVFDFEPFWNDEIQKYVYQSVFDYEHSLDTFTLIEQLRRLFLKHKFAFLFSSICSIACSFISLTVVMWDVMPGWEYPAG